MKITYEAYIEWSKIYPFALANVRAATKNFCWKYIYGIKKREL